MDDRFLILLERWDIEEHRVDQVADETFRTACVMSAVTIGLFILLGLIWSYREHYIWKLVSGAFLLGSFLSLHRFWRWDVLSNRRYITPTRWLIGLFWRSDAYK